MVLSTNIYYTMFDNFPILGFIYVVQGAAVSMLVGAAVNLVFISLAKKGYAPKPLDFRDNEDDDDESCI